MLIEAIFSLVMMIPGTDSYFICVLTEWFHFLGCCRNLETTITAIWCYHIHLLFALYSLFMSRYFWHANGANNIPVLLYSCKIHLNAVSFECSSLNAHLMLTDVQMWWWIWWYSYMYVYICLRKFFIIMLMLMYTCHLLRRYWCFLQCM